METWMAGAPLCAVALGTLALSATFAGRRRSGIDPSAWRAPLLWTLGLLGLALVPLWHQAPLLTIARCGGLVLLLLAGGLGMRALRARAAAEALRSCSPRPIDDAVDGIRSGGRASAGVYQGRLDARGRVTSPSGVVCAFFTAELRGASAGPGKGPLIARERRSATGLLLRGHREAAEVRFAPEASLAPEAARRCLTRPQAAASDPRVFAGAPPVAEAVSFERVGKLGTECLVVGRLVPEQASGAWVLEGAHGGPALLLLEQEPLEVARRLRGTARRLFAAAVALVGGAALLSARLGA